jgi:hypothetical protein
MSDKPIAERRGCEWDDFGDAITLVAVRAGVEAVADALGKRYKKPVEKVDPTDTSEKHPDISNVVFSHQGHAYSVFASTDTGANLAGDLSKALNTRAISLLHEDTAGWTECRIFDSGENVETYSFGPDYADEIETLAEELGEDAGDIVANDDGKPFDHQVNIDGNDFRFRSQLRKVSKDAVSDWDAMVNDMFASIEAWMPGWAHFPFSDRKQYPNEPKSQFVAALRVKLR